MVKTYRQNEDDWTERAELSTVQLRNLLSRIYDAESEGSPLFEVSYSERHILPQEGVDELQKLIESYLYSVLPDNASIVATSSVINPGFGVFTTYNYPGEKKIIIPDYETAEGLGFQVNISLASEPGKSFLAFSRPKPFSRVYEFSLLYPAETHRREEIVFGRALLYKLLEAI